MKKLVLILVFTVYSFAQPVDSVVVDSTDFSIPEYRLQPGDKLELIVLQRTDLSGEYTISPEGGLDLPGVNRIIIFNLTREEAEDKIRQSLKMNYQIISIILKIKSYQNSDFFVILGEVNEPGTYPIKNKISLIDAVGIARGFSDDANIRKIILVRKSDEKQVIKINMKKWLKKGDYYQNYILQNEDIIYVKKNIVATALYPLKQFIPVVQVGLLSLITINQL